MQCQCGKRMKCVESRPVSSGGARRRYHCACGDRLTTLEIVAGSASEGRKIIGQIRGNEILHKISAICQAAIKEGEGR